MNNLIVGASGATGKLLVNQLLHSGQKVKVIIRSTSNIPDFWKTDDNITIIEREITGISIDEMKEYLSDCQGAASCLGHNLTWKGIYGKPRELVTDTVKLIGEAIQASTPNKPIKFVLMNLMVLITLL